MSLLWSFPKNTSCVFLLTYSPSGACTTWAKEVVYKNPTIAPEGQNVNRNRITKFGCAPEVRYWLKVDQRIFSSLISVKKNSFTQSDNYLNLRCRSSGAFRKIHFLFSINILPLRGKYPFLSLSDLSVSSETCSRGAACQ